MTTGIGLAVYALVVHLLGFAVILGLSTGRWLAPWPMRFGTYGLVGMVSVYFVGLVLLLTMQAIAVVPLWAGLALVAVLALARRRACEEDLATEAHGLKRRWTLVEAALLGLAAVQVLYILFESFWRPVAMHDDITHWAGSAKYIYWHGFVGWDYFRQIFHCDYPLFIMINEVALSHFGRWSDFACKSFLVILLLDGVLILATEVAQRRSRLSGLVFAVLLLTMPTYVRMGLDGTADAPLAFLLAASVALFLRSRRTGQEVDGLASAILLGAVTVTKGEGLFAALGVLAVLLFGGIVEKRTASKYLAESLIAILVLLGPWAVVKGIIGCGASQMVFADGSRFFTWEAYSTAGIELLFPVTPTGCRFSFLVGPYFVIALLAFLSGRADGVDQRYLLGVIASVAAIYMGGSILIQPQQYHRLLAHLFPLMLFFAGLQALELLREPAAVATESREG